MNIEVSSGRNNMYGFPFTFYKILGGKRFLIPENGNVTSIGYLVVDLVFSGVLAFGGFRLLKELKKRNE